MDSPWKPLVWFEGEDEAALIDRFVELSALHPTRSEYDIARYIFQDLVDPEMRSMQAAQRWKRDLAIEERIRKYKLYGKTEAPPTEEQAVAAAWQIVKNPMSTDKDKLDAIKTVASILGYIKKAPTSVELTGDIPTFVIAQYDD